MSIHSYRSTHMIHVPVAVHLRKNKVPEAFTQSLRVFISRETRQSQLASSTTQATTDKTVTKAGDISTEGAQLTCHCRCAVHSHGQLPPLQKQRRQSSRCYCLISSLNRHLRPSLRLFQRLLNTVFAFFIYKQAERWVIQPSY